MTVSSRTIIPIKLIAAANCLPPAGHTNIICQSASAACGRQKACFPNFPIVMNDKKAVPKEYLFRAPPFLIRFFILQLLPL